MVHVVISKVRENISLIFLFERERYMYQIIEFFANQPNATALDAVSYFEEQFEISNQLKYLTAEAPETLRLKGLVKPLHRERSDLQEKIKYVMSDIESAIYIEYPPRKGTDAEREQMRQKLKKENANFQDLNQKLLAVGDKINDIDDEIDSVDRAAKNARRMTELLQAYILFINSYCSSEPKIIQVSSNKNIF